jgi:hypothetical protein
MKFSNEQLVEKLSQLGLVGINENGSFTYYQPVSYSAFKNRASIHRYGRTAKIVFVGSPKNNLFGFYVMCDTDSNVMKEAYNMFVNLVKGEMTEYNQENIQWGNCGIPISYGNLRQSIENNFAY